MSSAFCLCTAENHQRLRPNLTQAEGFITEIGAKMFIIARPVIVYGTAACDVWVYLLAYDEVKIPGIQFWIPGKLLSVLLDKPQ